MKLTVEIESPTFEATMQTVTLLLNRVDTWFAWRINQAPANYDQLRDQAQQVHASRQPADVRRTGRAD
jgi:hypothetical protein